MYYPTEKITLLCLAKIAGQSQPLVEITKKNPIFWHLQISNH